MRRGAPDGARSALVFVFVKSAGFRGETAALLRKYFMVVSSKYQFIEQIYPTPWHWFAKSNSHKTPHQRCSFALI